MTEITPDHQTVLGTLPFRPSDDSEEATYATAAAVTEVVPFGADKVRRLLSDLVDWDDAERDPVSRVSRYRRTMTEEEAWKVDDENQGLSEVPVTTSAGDASGEAAGAPSDAVGAPATSAVGDVAAFMRAARPVAADAADENVPAPKTGECSVCKTGITKDGRSWKHDSGDVSHKATTAKVREQRATDERPADAPPIYGKGELKNKIITWLRKQDEGVTFSAAEVAKAVGGQNGSVQFALDSFVSKGEATLTQAKQKRYAAA